MKIELDDRGAGVTPARPPEDQPLTCHGTPIGTLGCAPSIVPIGKDWENGCRVHCSNCGTWGNTAWEIAPPGMTAEEARADMGRRAIVLWETKPTTTYGDL